MKKRRGILFIGVVVLVVVLGAALLQTGIGSSQHVTRDIFALDTYIRFDIYGTEAKQAADIAVEKVYEVEKLMNAYDPESNLSVLNRSAQTGQPVSVDSRLFAVISRAVDFSWVTAGLFDITVKPVMDLWSFHTEPQVPKPEALSQALSHVGYKKIQLDSDRQTVTFLDKGCELDLGGIAKGYAADVISKELLKLQIDRAVIDLGGNVVVLGENDASWQQKLLAFFTGRDTAESNWTIGIQTPFAPSGQTCLLLKVDQTTCSVVTSGAYERNFEQEGVLYHHIINPKTGYPAQGEIDSVSVIGASSMEADALSTSIYIMGIEEGIELARSFGYDVVIIDKNKKIHTTLSRDLVEIVDNAYTFFE